MGVVIDYEALKGSENETVIKEMSLVADGVIRTLLFQAPYDMQPHVSAENGLNWDDGHILIISNKRLLTKLYLDTPICIHTTLRKV